MRPTLAPEPSGCALRPRRPGTTTLVLSLVVSLGLVCTPTAASAGQFEVAVYGGTVVPFYDQTFDYDPGPLPVSIPGLSVEQVGTFHLDASGALALSGGVTWFFSDRVGLEGRLDTADVSVPVTGARYRVRIDLPAPLPDLSQDVSLGDGEVDLERLLPVSLNLRFRTGSFPRVTASGGLSYLPSFRFSAVQGVALPDLGSGGRDLDLFQVQLGAAEVEGEGRFGFNAGVGLQFAVGGPVSLGLEGRYFYFQEASLAWDRTGSGGPLSVVQDLLAERVEETLEPVRFNPTFFHVVGTVTISF